MLWMRYLAAGNTAYMMEERTKRFILNVRFGKQTERVDCRHSKGMSSSILLYSIHLKLNIRCSYNVLQRLDWDASSQIKVDAFPKRMLDVQDERSCHSWMGVHNPLFCSFRIWNERSISCTACYGERKAQISDFIQRLTWNRKKEDL